MIELGRVADAEGGEVLDAAPVPLQGQTQRSGPGLRIADASGSEGEADLVIAGQLDHQGAPARLPEAHGQLDPVVGDPVVGQLGLDAGA
jgi:hypothetical protein